MKNVQSVLIYCLVNASLSAMGTQISGRIWVKLVLQDEEVTMIGRRSNNDTMTKKILNWSINHSLWLIDQSQIINHSIWQISRGYIESSYSREIARKESKILYMKSINNAKQNRLKSGWFSNNSCHTSADIIRETDN